ncbi:hypothetical protein LTSESEN_6612, partial [Salmonella enterica subsp. enterica serovar Senftenberg str. A4-543]
MLSFITVECVLEVRMKRHYIFASHGTLVAPKFEA